MFLSIDSIILVFVCMRFKQNIDRWRQAIYGKILLYTVSLLNKNNLSEHLPIFCRTHAVLLHVQTRHKEIHNLYHCLNRTVARFVITQNYYLKTKDLQPFYGHIKYVTYSHYLKLPMIINIDFHKLININKNKLLKKKAQASLSYERKTSKAVARHHYGLTVFFPHNLCILIFYFLKKIVKNTVGKKSVTVQLLKNLTCMHRNP